MFNCVLKGDLKMENVKIPAIPERSKYKFNDIKENGYKKLYFESSEQAEKARVAAFVYANLHGIKFVTRVSDKKNLEVWLVAKPDPFFGEI
jgi:hypothetical protein